MIKSHSMDSKTHSKAKKKNKTTPKNLFLRIVVGEPCTHTNFYAYTISDIRFHHLYSGKIVIRTHKFLLILAMKHIKSRQGNFREFLATEEEAIRLDKLR